MSDKSPAVQFYFKDFLVDTAHLTAEQVGCYIRLLGYAWTGIAGCPQGAIPVDLKILGRLTQVGTKKGKRILVPVTALWEKKGRFFFHKRLVEELQKQREWSAKSRLGGIASAKTRKQQRTTVEPRGQPKGNSSSSSSSSSSPSTPEPEKKEGQSSASVVAGEAVRIWNEGLDPKVHIRSTPKRIAKAKTRLQEFGADQLLAVVKAIRKSSWHMGDNDRRWKAPGPEWVWNSTERVEEWLNKNGAVQVQKPEADPDCPNCRGTGLDRKTYAPGSGKFGICACTKAKA